MKSCDIILGAVLVLELGINCFNSVLHVCNVHFTFVLRNWQQSITQFVKYKYYEKAAYYIYYWKCPV